MSFEETLGTNKLLVWTKPESTSFVTWLTSAWNIAKHPLLPHRRSGIRNTKRLQLDQQIDQLFHRWSAYLANIGSVPEGKHKAGSEAAAFSAVPTLGFLQSQHLDA